MSCCGRASTKHPADSSLGQQIRAAVACPKHPYGVVGRSCSPQGGVCSRRTAEYFARERSPR